MEAKNNVVLITGGGSGIGLALAKQFYENANRVIIVGRNEEKLKRIKGVMSNIEYYRADLSDTQSLRHMVEQNGDVNIVVNNAGIQENYSFADEGIDTDIVINEVQVNLLSPLLLTKMFLPQLMAHKSSAIVNVTSGLAFVPKESAGVYCATKAALHSFSISLRWQLQETSVKLYEIIPPLVETDMTQGRGKNKISPEELAEGFWKDFIEDKYESRIGKVRALYWINRFMPGLAEKIIRRS